MSEEHDTFTDAGSSEPSGEPPGPDKLLSLVCVLWLLNSAIGARVAVKEGLPAEWVGALYAGRDASAVSSDRGDSANFASATLRDVGVLFG
jgi:hypothetical protein